MLASCVCVSLVKTTFHYASQLSLKLQTTSAVQATAMAFVFSILQKIGQVTRSCHTHDCRNHQALSKFAAGMRHACYTLMQVCDQVFDQVCSWLE